MNLKWLEKWPIKNPIDIRTIAAADIIAGLLTEEERDLLNIRLAGQEIPLVQQLTSRWWDQVPIDDNPITFEAKVAQILATNKRWLTLIAKLKQEDFLLKLLDPESYKEQQNKWTAGKTLDNREVESTNDNTSLIKSIGRTISGQGGTNRDTDYGSMWDQTDRARLDAVKIKRIDRNISVTETGQEDDTRGTDEQEMTKPSDVIAFINKDHRLEKRRILKKGDKRSEISLSDDYKEIEEKRIDIFDLGLNHSTSATVSDNAIDQSTNIEAVKRQGFFTFRDRMILAEAINNLHNVEFPDTREKFYKLFDPLFRRVQKICQ